MNSRVTRMVYCAVLSAMIFIFTRFASVPLAMGYVHFGDVLIYLTGALLGGWMSVAAAALGAAFADLSFGFAAYAPATVLIKSAVALLFALAGRGNGKILSPRTAISLAPAGIITVLGYFAADMIINRAYAVANLPANAIQAVGSAVLFVIIATALDRLKLKKKLFKR